MFEESFIPPGLRDLITIFTTIVALVTILQVLQLKRFLSPVVESETRRRFFRELPWALTFTFIVCVLVALAIWVLHALLTSLSTEGVKEATIVIGCSITLLAGYVLGMPAAIGIQFHKSTHIAFATSILVWVYLLGLLAWPETNFRWITMIEQLWPTAVVTLVGLVGYAISARPLKVVIDFNFTFRK